MKILKDEYSELYAENINDHEKMSVFLFKVPGYSAWFNMVYEGDQAVYSYQLMSDYSKGDVEICVQDI